MLFRTRYLNVYSLGTPLHVCPPKSSSFPLPRWFSLMVSTVVNSMNSIWVFQKGLPSPSLVITNLASTNSQQACHELFKQDYKAKQGLTPLRYHVFLIHLPIYDTNNLWPIQQILLLATIPALKKFDTYNGKGVANF